MMHTNPFEGLSLKETYEGLMVGRSGFPRWPDVQTQKGFTNISGVPLLKRTYETIEALAEDGAFVENWKGLDYGCGFGRFATVLLARGSAEQLDIADAWPKALRMIKTAGFKNRLFQVSEFLQDGEIPEKYDFILSYSVFTHLAPKVFKQNLGELLKLLKPEGRAYITVRNEEFVAHRYPDRVEEARVALKKDGCWFVQTKKPHGEEVTFGDQVVTMDFINEIGKATYVGLPHPLQHIIRVEAR